MDLPLTDVLDILSRATASTAAVLIIWALVTERIVPKRRLDELRQDFEAAQEDCNQRLRALEEDRRRIIADRDRMRRQERRHARDS